MGEVVDIPRSAPQRVLGVLESETVSDALDALMTVAVFLVRQSDEPQILSGHLVLTLAANLLEDE